MHVASEDDFSTVDSDYESADEGPFQFRRKEGVQYLAPTDWSENEVNKIKNIRCSFVVFKCFETNLYTEENYTCDEFKILSYSFYSVIKSYIFLCK